MHIFYATFKGVSFLRFCAISHLVDWTDWLIDQRIYKDIMFPVIDVNCS